MSGLIEKPYYRYFKNIKGSVVEIITLEMVDLWTMEEHFAFFKFQQVASIMNDLYDIPQIAGGVHRGTREVYYHTGRIELPKVSLISFLHEYRHHMQKHGKQHYRDVEEDARGWSISLFAQSFPDKFDRAWKNQRIWFLPPYSENWRQEVGLT